MTIRFQQCDLPLTDKFTAGFANQLVIDSEKFVCLPKQVQRRIIKQLKNNKKQSRQLSSFFTFLFSRFVVSPIFSLWDSSHERNHRTHGHDGSSHHLKIFH